MLDSQALLDLAGIYRTWNSRYNNWSVFGQDHVARVLLEYPEAQTHDAVGDALKSIRLYNLSRQLQQDPAVWQQAQVKFVLNQFLLSHGRFHCKVSIRWWIDVFCTCFSATTGSCSSCEACQHVLTAVAIALSFLILCDASWRVLCAGAVAGQSARTIVCKEASVT